MSPPETIRAVTINLWGEQPPLEARLRGLVAGLASLAPDLIALQEVRQVPGVVDNTAATLAGRLGMAHAWAPSSTWGGGEEGLAVLSRYPIRAHAVTELPHATADERRIVLHATVETPRGALEAFTTHLTYRLADGQKREDQLVAVEAVVAAAPSELPKLLLGDLNAVPDSDEIRWLRGLRSIAGRRVHYQDAWALARPGEPGYTWAKRNPHAQRLRFLELDRRIDYVFVSPLRRDGRGLVRDCRIVLDAPDPDGVFPSDHFGVLAEVQIAPDA